MSLFRRRRDEDIAEEIDTHLALAQDEYLRRGMSPDEARLAAHRALGGALKTRYLYREQRGSLWLANFIQDARFGVRTLLRDRAFALTTILVLGVGIGVNNMMFTLLYGSALRGLPIAAADRVLYVSTFDKQFPDRPLSFREFDELRRQARSFSSLAAFTSAPLSVGEDGRAPDRFEGAYTSAGAFETIGITPLIGRTFRTDEDRIGAEPVVLLSRRAWQARYNADEEILGRSVFVDGIAATIVGVIPDRSGFPSTAEVWLPLSHAPGAASPARETRTLRVFGRLDDAAQEEDARLEVASIIAAVAHASGNSDGLGARVVPINDRFFGGLGHPAWLPFIVASILVVLVSCANAANLMIGRSLLRAREFAVRGSLGATRARMIRQFLAEALVLASLGAATGWIISFSAARLFELGIPEQTLPYWLHYGMDLRILAVLIAVALGTVLLFGLVPALQASRLDVNTTLREGGRPGLAPRGSRLTSVFLIAQLAMSIVMLSQLIVSLQVQGPVVTSDRVIDTASLVSANVSLPQAQYDTPGARLRYYERLEQQLARIPGVAGVTIASHLPHGGGRQERLELDGRTSSELQPPPAVHTVTVGPGYFKTLGVSLLQGREFNSHDGRPGAFHAIVNARFAQVFFSSADAMGRLIRVASSNAPANDAPWLTIIGVAADIRQRSLPDTDPVVYVPLAIAPPSSSSIIVRTALEPSAIAQAVREEAARIDAHLPLYRVMTMKQVLEDARWNARASHNLILTITAVALVLSLVGLYAVTAHAVARRSQEIGIRVALGAAPRQVRRLILSRAFTHVALGAAFGLMGAKAWDSAFSSGRAGFLLVSPEVLGPVVLLLAVLTFAACLVPIRRALRLDPVATLRQD